MRGPARAALRAAASTLAGAAFLCFLGALPTAPAFAAPAWLAASDLSAAGQSASEPEVALDAAGNASALWSRSNGTNTIVQSATRPAGGPGSRRLTSRLSARTPKRPSSPSTPRATRWLSGSATTAPTTSSRARPNRPAAWRPRSTSPRRARAPPNPRSPSTQRATRRRSGRHSNGTNTIIQSATKGRWRPGRSRLDLSAAGQSAEAPQVAVDPAGDAVAIWQRSNGTNTIVQSATRPAGGPWHSPLDLSAAGQSASEPEVALDAAGNASALWSRSDGTNTIIQSATKPAGGAWQPALDLSAAGKNAEAPQLAVDAAGNAVAIWRRYNGTNYIVQSSTRPAGGPWQPPLDLSAAGQSASEPQLAVDSAGNALAIWSLSNGSNTIVQSATRPAGGSWQVAHDLSTIGRNASEPQIAVDPEANAVAVWSRFDGANSIVQSAGYDAAGPRLRSLLIPTAGTVRQPLAFSVSPFDVWSAIGSVNWSFGDGATASGAGVSHTYASPGVYPVSVTAADALANASAASGTVTIFAKASAARFARVRRGRALLRLHCPSTAGCEGEVRLIAGVKVRRHHHSLGKRLAIGSAAFAIPARQTTTVAVKLSAKGRMAVSQAGRKGLKAQLTGTGVKHRLVLMVPLHR